MIIFTDPLQSSVGGGGDGEGRGGGERGANEHLRTYYIILDSATWV